MPPERTRKSKAQLRRSSGCSTRYIRAQKLSHSRSPVILAILVDSRKVTLSATTIRNWRIQAKSLIEQKTGILSQTPSGGDRSELAKLWSVRNVSAKLWSQSCEWCRREASITKELCWPLYCLNWP